ncbi:MAG: 3-isopropylmalate dehydrogenase, partial [bacterium]
MQATIAILAGDGIGPEIMTEARKVLTAIEKKYNHQFTYKEAYIGGAAIDAVGKAFPEETKEICRASDCILFGSVGGPKWENLPREEQPERAALLPIRKEFKLFANLRPSVVYKPLASQSLLKQEIVGDGFDILIVRELTGGIYFGKPREITNLPDGQQRGVDTMTYTTDEIIRIGRVAFEAARKRKKQLTSVDKANVLDCSVLWRETMTKLATEYPDVEMTHMYVDNAAMQLVRWPRQFDVIVTENMFGDILSDLAAVL